jgi:hypothetical protein
MSNPLSNLAVGLLASTCLAASAAQDKPLTAERWRTRPLVVVAPAADDPLQVQDELRRDRALAAFQEREMLLFTVIGGEGRRDGQPLTSNQTRSLLTALGATATGPATLYLIGKDGGIKLSERGDKVSLEAVFGEIDKMPMRRP